jgi:RNA polymerase sigma-70 factor, ECF subfamily
MGVDPMAGPTEPAELLARVGAGDPEALERFYDLAVDGLYAFVFYRVGKDAALAEDVVQDTFLLALDRTREFDAKRGSLGSWVCQLSRNVIRGALRTRGRAQEQGMWDRIDEGLAEAFARMDGQALAHDVLEKRETQDLVHVAMSHLSDAHRTVLERKYVEERSLAEIAAELELSEDAVKSLLARARRAFRETFQSLGRTLSEAES